VERRERARRRRA